MANKKIALNKETREQKEQRVENEIRAAKNTTKYVIPLLAILSLLISVCFWLAFGGGTRKEGLTNKTSEDILKAWETRWKKVKAQRASKRGPKSE